jgi:hypothetical protein
MATQKIINSVDGARLYELDQFKSMLSDLYLYDENHPQTKFILEQFYKYEDRQKSIERIRLLNLSYSLPSLIVEKFADYVGQPEIEGLDFDIDDYISSYIWGGTAIFRPSIDNGVFNVSHKYPNEYILNDDGTERLLTYYYNTNSEGDIYIFEEFYKLNNVTRKLYKISKLQNGNKYSIEGTQVSLDSIPQTVGLAEIEVFEGLTKSPLVVVNNRKLIGYKYGTSEIRKIRSLISSIEIEAFNIQDQFLKHLQSKYAVPNSAMKPDPKTGLVNVRDLEIIGMETGDTLPAYITNSNPLIDKSFEQIEAYLRQICAIITLPTEFMGLKDGGSAESADTKKIRLASFIKKVEKIRRKFERAFIEILEIKKVWAKEKVGEAMISWPSIFPIDNSQVANELAIAQDSKLISNLKAIMIYQGLTREEALVEQQAINQERANIDININ